MLRLPLIPAFFLLVLAFASGCSELTPGPTQTPLNGSAASPFSALAPETTPMAGATPGPGQVQGCIGAKAIEEIRAEYAANHLRARETYIGKRICLRGTISIFYENERHGGVGVTVWDDIDLPLLHMNRDMLGGSSEELNRWRAWRAWMLASSVGDSVEAECEIAELAPTKDNPKETPGTPVLQDCQRVVDGVLWTAPAATPPPTPTSLPCAPVVLGDPNGTWLSIDCPAGTVTLGDGPVYPDEREELRTLMGGDSNIVAFYFHSIDEDLSDDPYGHHSPWNRRVEERVSKGGVRLAWEAPSETASAIISEWRRGVAVELFMLVGDCCFYDMYFELPRPPG